MKYCSYCFLIFFLILVGCSTSYVLETELPFTYTVAPTGGVGVSDDGSLNFGQAPPFSKLFKSFNMTNNYEVSQRFYFSVIGNSSGVIFISPSNVWTIPPGETQSFEITLIPGEVDYGDYNGTLLLYRKPSNEKNTHEWMELKPPFILDTYFEVVKLVNMCSEKNPSTSSDFGFSSPNHFRSILRC